MLEGTLREELRKYLKNRSKERQRTKEQNILCARNVIPMSLDAASGNGNGKGNGNGIRSKGTNARNVGFISGFKKGK